MAGAKSAGIQVEALKRQVAADIEPRRRRRFSSDMAEASGSRTCAATATSTYRLAMLGRDPLVKNSRGGAQDATVAVIPSVARPRVVWGAISWRSRRWRE
jgi:hypothetical protein